MSVPVSFIVGALSTSQIRAYEAEACAMTPLINQMIIIGKISIAKYPLKAAKSHKLIIHPITKCPPNTKITKTAKLEIKIINGIIIAKNHKILSDISFALELASKNLLYSNVCELRSLTSEDPSIVSLIILLSQSIVSWVSLNKTRTFDNTRKNVTHIIGTIDKTASANFQLIINSKILAQKIKKTEEIIDEIACETNVFTESTSEVRLVRSFQGVTS